jgi:hypothetical protein
VAAKGRPQFWFARFRVTTGGATWLDMTQEYSDPSEFGSSGRVGLVPGVTRAGDSRNPHERVGTIKTAASSLCVFGFWKAQSVYGFAAELGAGVDWGLKDILSTHHGVLADVRSYFSRHLLNLGLNL